MQGQHFRFEDRGARAANEYFGITPADEPDLAALATWCRAKDRAYGPLNNRNFIYFDPADTPETLCEKFSRIVANGWYGPEGKHPSLPTVAAALINNLKMTTADITAEEAALARTIIHVALCAEKVRGQVPQHADGSENPYHNSRHTAWVAMNAAYLAAKHNDMAVKAGEKPLTRREMLVQYLAAIGHDIDHPGTGNPQDDIFKNEKISYDVIKKIAAQYGVTRKDREDLFYILMTTSPNGPHQYLKDSLKEQEGKEAAADSPLHNSAMKKLLPIRDNPRLAQRAAIMSDADLSASAGLGEQTHDLTSIILTEETQAAGIDLDFRTPQSAIFFFDNVLGRQGFVSKAGKAVYNPNFEELYAAKAQKLEARAEGP